MHRWQSSHEEARRRRDARDVDPFDWDQDVELANRVPPATELKERENALLDTGIRVHTRVGFSHFTDIPLLVIYVDAYPPIDQPQDLFSNRFTRWTTERTSNPVVHRHISIAFMNDLEAVPDWRRKFENIHSKFNNEDVILIPNYISKGQVLFLDPVKDPIASDPDIRALHSTHGEIHVSM